MTTIRIKKTQSYIDDQLVTTYLNIFGTTEADILSYFLPRPKFENESKHFIRVPLSEVFMTRVMEALKVKNEIFQKLKTVSGERIIYPNLSNSFSCHRHPAQVRWPGEQTEEEKLKAQQELLDSGRYSEVEIERKRISFGLRAKPTTAQDFSEKVVQDIADNLSEMINSSLFDIKKPGTNLPVLESIMTASNVFDEPIGEIKSKGGYIEVTAKDLESIDGYSLKKVLFNLPQGYRLRAVWVMNSKTAKALLKMKDSEGNSILLEDDHRKSGDSKIPKWLLSKPIVICENMPNTGIVAFLADLSRGYMIRKLVENAVLSIKRETGEIVFEGFWGGLVVQKPTFKGLKFTKEVPIPVIETEEE